MKQAVLFSHTGNQLIMSVYISLILKSHSTLFLKPTSTKQSGLIFLLKETMGAFDGAWTHHWQVSTDYKSDTIPIVPPMLINITQQEYSFACWHLPTLYNTINHCIHIQVYPGVFVCPNTHAPFHWFNRYKYLKLGISASRQFWQKSVLNITLKPYDTQIFKMSTNLSSQALNYMPIICLPLTTK